jgi:hypothetical protein
MDDERAPVSDLGFSPPENVLVERRRREVAEGVAHAAQED